jgi:RimJ/RimL family protein N-acetyltransferase
MVGFHMLRGWDAGYEVPAYGVFISSGYNGLGLGKLSLQHAISFCRVNKIKKIMLKAHPENRIAKRLYEASGFIRQGMDKKNNNLIYIKEL